MDGSFRTKIRYIFLPILAVNLFLIYGFGLFIFMSSFKEFSWFTIEFALAEILVQSLIFMGGSYVMTRRRLKFLTYEGKSSILQKRMALLLIFGVPFYCMISLQPTLEKVINTPEFRSLFILQKESSPKQISSASSAVERIKAENAQEKSDYFPEQLTWAEVKGTLLKILEHNEQKRTFNLISLGAVCYGIGVILFLSVITSLHIDLGRLEYFKSRGMKWMPY